VPDGSSPSGDDVAGRGVGLDVDPDVVNTWPHSPQNMSVGNAGAPHALQILLAMTDCLSNHEFQKRFADDDLITVLNDITPAWNEPVPPIDECAIRAAQVFDQILSVLIHDVSVSP
jgi:hypothetical protein